MGNATAKKEKQQMTKRITKEKFAEDFHQRGWGGADTGFPEP